MVHDRVRLVESADEGVVIGVEDAGGDAMVKFAAVEIYNIGQLLKLRKAPTH